MIWLVLTACTAKPSDTTDTGGDTTPTSDTTDTVDTTPIDTGEVQGGCGDVNTYDVQIVGMVVGTSGNGSPGAYVRLEERAREFEPRVYGSAYTDAYGNFTLSALQIVAVEDCWGIAVDYNVVAELGVAYGEDQVNQPLYNAIYMGNYIADITTFPIEIQ